MFLVLFEVVPRPERRDAYLAIARMLRPELEQVPGFVENERYESRRRPGRILSLSAWRDEKAVVRWRTRATHNAAQQTGRSLMCADYHLRVGEVTADSTATQPLPARRLDETETGLAKAVSVTEIPGTGEGARETSTADAAALVALPLGDDALVAHEPFASLTTPGKLLLIAGWRSAAAAAAWRPQPVAGLRHRTVRVVREYGLADRAEAPQYYPPIPASDP
jgi:heme-degrading monooxygenase HmoA